MRKTTQEIAAKVLEIYELAHASPTPIGVLSLQSTILLGQHEWEPTDIETVSGQVMALLIKNGWNTKPVGA